MIIRLPEGERAHGVWCWLLLLAPAGCLVATFPVLAASPGAWGAAEDAGMPDWWPSATGGLTAAAILALCSKVIAGVKDRTSASFHLQLLPTFGGAVIFVASGTMALLMAARIGDPSSYESMGSEGRTDIGQLATFIGWAGAMLAWFGVLAAGSGTYVGGIEPTIKRYERQPGEPDALGAVMKEEQLLAKQGPPGRRPSA